MEFSASEKIPPSNIEAEESILGGILLDPDALPRVADKLKPEHFYVSGHRDIYKAALLLNAEGKPNDLILMAEKLNAMNWLAGIGGRNKLASLVTRTVSAVNIDSLADLVIEKHQRRQLIKAAGEIDHLAYQESDIKESLGRAEELVIGVGNQVKSAGIIHISDVLINCFQNIEARHQGAALPGIPCGYYDLDAMTSGFQRQDLIIVGARPSMGKTSFGVNIAQNIAALYKIPVVIFSLEMSKEQLTDRLLSSEAGIETGYLRSGRISKTQWEPLSRAIGMLSEMPIFIFDSPITNLMEMRTHLRRLAAEVGEIGLVVVDYLGLLEHCASGATTNERLSKVSWALKSLAKEFKVPVLALSQLNRSVEGRQNKRPMLSDLRDSGSLEQDADVVIFLYRDDYYNSDSPDRGVAEVIIAKHRNGPTGTVKLLFDPQFTKFKNLARPGGEW